MVAQAAGVYLLLSFLPPNIHHMYVSFLSTMYMYVDWPVSCLSGLFYLKSWGGGLRKILGRGGGRFEKSESGLGAAKKIGGEG